MEGLLIKDMATVGNALAVFHINNKEGKHELKVNFNNETLPFAPSPNTAESYWPGHLHITNTLSHLTKS